MRQAATDMNVLFSKFFGQALGECPDTEFTGRKHARSGVAPDRGRSSCEDQSTFLPGTTLSAFTWLFDVISGELEQDFSGKGEGSENIDIQRLAHFLFGDVQERLPHAIPGIEHCNAEGGSGRREVGPDTGERGANRGWSVIWDWERCSLITANVLVRIMMTHELCRTSPPL